MDGRVFVCRFSFFPVMSLLKFKKGLACAVMSFALFIAIGGPLALLQGLAWATMLQNFSKTSSLSQAFAMTFDGHHPCPLCEKLAKTRASEEKTPLSLKVDRKSDLFIASVVSELPLPLCRSGNYGSAPFVLIPERFFAPPVPVPIGLLYRA